MTVLEEFAQVGSDAKQITNDIAAIKERASQFTARAEDVCARLIKEKPEAKDQLEPILNLKVSVDQLLGRFN